MSGKTHAELIKEMNCGPIPEHRHDREILRLYAAELDAAHKREKAEWVNANAGLAKLVDIEKAGDCAKLREAISNLRTALKEIRNDVLDMVMNYKSEDPDSYAHGLCLSIGGACDMALNSTKEFDNANK